MQFMANIREYFIQTNSVQVIFTCNFSQRQSKNHFCLEPFLSSIPRNGKYISCCKIFEYVLLSYASFFLPNRRNSFVQRFCDWSCFNCLGELANNCSFCIEEETTQEKFVSGCKYGVCRCHVRSCVASLFCLLGRRSSISTMEYILWSSIGSRFLLHCLWCHFLACFCNVSSLHIVWKILRCKLVTETSNTVKQGIYYHHNNNLDAGYYCWRRLLPYWKTFFTESSSFCLGSNTLYNCIHIMCLQHWYLAKVSKDKCRFFPAKQNCPKPTPD